MTTADDPQGRPLRRKVGFQATAMELACLTDMRDELRKAGVRVPLSNLLRTAVLALMEHRRRYESAKRAYLELWPDIAFLFGKRRNP